MSINKPEILKKICYTELVYQRINKKLKNHYSKKKKKKMLLDILNETQEKYFERIGKNIYVTNSDNNIKITINSNTFRIITVDKIDKR